MTSVFISSDLLGYTSIACWLGAQFPQILENIRRQSCEGLALPFLANWFLGDFSNLVGCILTHQLPFQTYLATYFVCVDCVLVVQYFYYSRRTKATFSHPRSAISGVGVSRSSIERGASRYRTLSAVAANVAATAALAAQQDEQIDQRRRSNRRSRDRLHEASEGFSLGGGLEEDDDDEGALTALADSFHSEGGRDLGRKRVSWSIERQRRRGGSVGALTGIVRSSVPPHLQLMSPDPPPDTTNQGHLLQQEVDSPNQRSSRSARRGAPIVFLSVWILFGIGTLTGNMGNIPARSDASVGRVLAIRDFGMSESIPSPTPLAKFSTPAYPTTRATETLLQDPNPTEPFSERIIGRLFAWLCTTMYLTSRLPQIWKNFVRKSVEGLSMYLFVFAFLGNTFYVASILSSPKMQLPPPISTDFIRESIPYLLGSGGTLIFDITIVAQSFIYRPRPRRYSSSHSRMEEEAGLLQDEAIIGNANDFAALPRGRTSRIRNIV